MITPEHTTASPSTSTATSSSTTGTTTKVVSRKAPGYTRTKCDTCGEPCTYDETNVGAHRVWAGRHVKTNPTHEVYVVNVAARIYTTERKTP